ncbi:MAG TPA: GTP 3',8-cyclase MoaA [Thermoplasmata archaeon]|nr:GTP 3',8-cyclase MoaA [Thermoplasmata archaeon]
MLADAYGRAVTDLRISVTKRCNFGCIYCHDEGLGPVARPRAPHGEELTPAEVERLVSIGREFGIRSVKFTGGEPLVRDDLEEIVSRTVRHVADVSLTTNGSLLEGRAESLRDAGLKRVNVSVDSLDPEQFRSIRHGALAPVLRGIRAALAVGLTPVKLNLVVFRDTVKNIPGMIAYVGATEGLKLQLIQFMPELVPEQAWAVDIAEVRSWLESHASEVLVREMHHRRIYLFDRAEVELVDPVQNAEFCSNCHRVRVTHRGELKGCLNRNDDLIATRGLGDSALRAAFRRVITTRVPFYGVYVPADGVPRTGPPLLRIEMAPPAGR